MLRKVESNEYQSAEEVFWDVELVWDNCRTYNEAESQIVEDSNMLRRLFRTKWKASGLVIPVKEHNVKPIARRLKKPSENAQKVYRQQITELSEAVVGFRAEHYDDDSGQWHAGKITAFNPQAQEISFCEDGAEQPDMYNLHDASTVIKIIRGRW